MARQGESKLSLRIIKALRKAVGGWFFKHWAGPFSKTGIPDILGCVQGIFFAFEVKKGRNELEPIQIETIKRIREAGGIAEEIRSAEEAIAIVRKHLSKAPPKVSSRLPPDLHRALHSWRMMMDRCYDKKNINYGGRGISVCARWHSPENFLEDMGGRPEGMSLEREDNEAGYDQDNCKWATRHEQNTNKRNNVFATYRGKTKTTSEWADELDIPRQTLRRALRKGQTLAAIIQAARRRSETRGRSSTPRQDTRSPVRSRRRKNIRSGRRSRAASE